MVCEQDRTLVETPVVETQRDGVHVRIDNRGEGERAVYLRVDAAIRHLHQAPEGISEATVSEFGPGRWDVICVRANVYPEDDGPWTSWEVNDPDDLWVPMRLGCLYPTGEHPDYREDLEGGRHLGEPRDPLHLAREELPEAVPGFSDGDVVEPAGYPDAAPRRFRVVRDGEITAVAWYRFDGQGGWFFGGIEYCEDEPGSNLEPSGS